MTIETLPINSLSAFNYRRFLILAVALRAYCDGSGKSDDPRSNYLTLAGFIGSPPAWDAFEKLWGETLTRHNCNYLHMIEATTLTGEFSSEKGWTEKRVLDLILDLANTCFSRDAVQSYKTFMAIHCTVNLADYRKATTMYPQLRRYKPEQFCVTQVVNRAASMLPDDSSRPLGKDGTVELYFDRGESFMKHVYRMWTAKGRKQFDPNIELISSIIPVNAKAVFGVQAADLLAWNLNRWFVTKEWVHGFIAFDVLPTEERIYMDYDKFIAAAKEEWPS